MADMPLSHITPYVQPAIMVLFASALGYMTARHLARREAMARLATIRKEDDRAMRDRITELERKLAVIGSTVEPISTAFQALLIKQLTHFHTPELDALLVKVGQQPYALEPKEEARLTELLAQRTTDMGELIDDLERDAAHILPFIIRRVRAEAALTHLDMKVVAVPKLETD
jgi:hypothetical protein